MGKYDGLTTRERVLLAHERLDDATLILKNLETPSDISLVVIGRYLAAFNEAFVQSQVFQAVLRKAGVMDTPAPVHKTRPF